jgi:predicted glycosyltransferase
MSSLLFYCHNVSGLGHIVRSLQIATAARRLGASACVIVTGCNHLRHVAVSPGLRLEQLPPLRKDGWQFKATDPALAGVDALKLRAGIILSICRRERPDAVLVDHSPLGLGNELLPTLTAAAEEGWPTRFVWGIPYSSRSALISPARPPGNPAIARAIAHYSSAVAYVDQQEVDVFSKFKPWVLPAKTKYVGFVAETPPPLGDMSQGLVAITCGGGTFAVEVCQLVLAARERLGGSEAVRLRILTGPMADSAAVAQALEGRRGVELWMTGHTHDAIRDAAAVVSCAGYNNAALLLRIGLPVVFLPVSDDQRDRTASIASLPGVWTLDPNAVNAVDLAVDALREALACGRVARCSDWDFNGADAAARWLLDEASDSTHPRRSQANKSVFALDSTALQAGGGR